jgi:hypothetical protein
MTILESDRRAWRGEESATSGTSWGAIFAGAAAALATTLILIVLGGGLGLASVSPWYRSGTSAATVGIAAIVWLVVVQWLASAIGGYMAGRLRAKWTGSIHDDEVFFRDTAHGFLAWCVASIAGAVLLAGAGAITLGGATSGAAVGRGGDQNAYFVDSLYRAAAASAPGAVTAGAGSANMGVDAVGAARSETGRILTRDFANGGVTPDDRAYLAQLVASRTGLSQSDAQTRVDQAIAQIDAARKRAAQISIVTALAMVIGAFIASVAGAFAGRLREEHDALYVRTYDTDRTGTTTTTTRRKP